jgi:phosphoribosyl 1,2-cyclic phosphodiesterase
MSRVERIVNLGSSSEGNAFYIEILPANSREPFNILIECGFEYKEMLRKLVENKIDVLDIDAVLVTHLHKDHSASFKTFHERGYKTYAPKSVFEHYNLQYSENNILKEYENKSIDDEIVIKPIPLEHHDANVQVENFGFIIEVSNDYHILFAIDTKYIPQDLSAYKFNLIFIEANYVENNIKFALFDAQRKQDRGKVARYKRLYNSHFSLENLAKTIDGSINSMAKPYNLSNCDTIFLMHLSSNKQTNEKYYTMFLSKFIDKTRHITNAKDTLRVVAMKKEGGFVL